MLQSLRIQTGILAFQGDIEEHEKAILSLGITPLRVQSIEDLESLTHLILPGGESTVIGKFLASTKLDEAIKKRVQEKSLQVYGTCAGCILLSKEVESKVPVNNLGLIDIKTSRNAYGSQIHSFSSSLTLEKTGQTFEGVFIRAPKILSIEPNINILIQHDEDVVMAEQDNVLVSTFHPELIRPAVIHEYFLSKK